MSAIAPMAHRPGTPVPPAPPTPTRFFRAALLSLAVLLGSGCERALFGFLNRGLPPPESTVVFAPELGLALDIYRPTRPAATPAPVVVFFYGGSWQRGERAQYRFVGQRLAANGILAIVADYRTMPRAGFPAFIDDAARAVRWTFDHAAQWGGDRERIFLAGHSAGAQIAALLATDGRYLQRRGVEVDALAGVIGLAGPYDFAITGKLEQVFGAPSQWPQAQPLNFVDGDEPPFLLVHGRDDRVVESADSVAMSEALRAHDVPARLLLLPDAGHSAPLAGLYDPQRVPAMLPAILGFIADPRAASSAAVAPTRP